MSHRCGKSDHPQTDIERGSIRASRLIDVRSAAAYLAVSVSTLYGWVWQKRIPFVKCGRALRFDLTDLEGFIAANKTNMRR